ncbi:MAG: DUF3302 domain-containing protein [Planctomycetota bacterium]
MLNGAALFVIFFLIIVVAVVIVFLGSLPGKIAAKRGHHQVDAVNAASWMGLATGGLLWPLAFIWAFIRRPGDTAGGGGAGSSSSEELARLNARLAGLEATIAKLKSQQKEDAS